MKLDAKTVAGLELPAGKSDAIFFDRDLPGFGVRLRASGDRVRRTWIAQYRAQGRTRRVLVGTPEKVTAADARTAAKKILAAVELGGDPQDAKAVKRQQSARTVRLLVSAYLEAKQLELRPVSFRITNLYLTGPYFRSLHPLAVTAVGRSGVAACVRAISRTHSTATAAAARRALSAFFAWAIAEGEMGDAPNPVQGSHRPADPIPRDRVLSDAELVAIWHACEEDDYGRIARLLILLGSRRQEIGGMGWTELELDARTWTLPPERSKNNRQHTVTLPPVALAIIKSVPRSARDHLFGDRAKIGFS
jgi:integrase